jgi:hypothetical protein
MGVTVLTGGESHYSHRGFTVDSTSQGDLLRRVGRIDDIEEISAKARALAERFAYAAFFAKPFRLSSLLVRFRDATNIGIEVEPTTRDGQKFAKSSDMMKFVEWLCNSDGEDYVCEEILPPVERGLVEDDLPYPVT